MKGNKEILLNPVQKLIFGLLFIPAYLLQQSIYIRTVQFIIIILMYILNGGKFRIMPNIILFTGIIFAYLVIPVGKVFFSVGSFPVTQGSLNSGIKRALMLIGLIYISRLAVSSKLELRGKTGNLIGKVFYYFEVITASKGEFHFRSIYKPGLADRLVNNIDALLFSVENKENKNEIKKAKSIYISYNFVILIIFMFILIAYLLLIPIFNEYFV